MGVIKHDLPWGYSDMEPYISQRIIEVHFDKHHQGYVSNYNNAMAKEENADLAQMYFTESLEVLANEIKSGNRSRIGIFRNGAQAWNHDFLWKSMSVGVDREIVSKLIPTDFDKFREIFVNAGLGRFASGWVWLVQNGNMIDICTTANEDAPMFNINNEMTIINPVSISKTKPLAVCDVWEHAYYLQYENNRKNYLEKFFDHLMNWDFVLGNFETKEEKHKAD